MADLTITVAGETKFPKIFTLIAAEAIAKGDAVRLDTSTGKITLANASSAAEARMFGIALNAATLAGQRVSVLTEGVIDVGDALSALTYDDDVFLSNTDGQLADAAGTVSVVVGKVIPSFVNGPSAADKLLLLTIGRVVAS